MILNPKLRQCALDNKNVSSVIDTEDFTRYAARQRCDSCARVPYDTITPQRVEEIVGA
jgi:hypothetical protein